jgi:hypothetical protein
MKATERELLSAIRKKCMDCSGNMRSEVRNCKLKDCPLHKYRKTITEDDNEADRS